jgi:CheY-like chemotaxis protein
MTADESLVGNVPFLRRFARALTGSQALGDACVVKALENILAGKATGIPARIALYRFVLAEVNAIEKQPPVRPDREMARVHENLSALTPMGRQAFMLVAMEDFTIPDASEILEMSVADVTQLLDDANQDLSQQIATDVVIIEDEPLIAMDLEALVQSLGHRVVRIALTERQAVQAVKEFKPGLVLADIQLADGSSGLNAVNEFLQIVNVPVIFVTAFPERLLTGTKPEPTFLVSKPFKSDMLKAVISQALFFDVQNRTAAETSLTR